MTSLLLSGCATCGSFTTIIKPVGHWGNGKPGVAVTFGLRVGDSGENNKPCTVNKEAENRVEAMLVNERMEMLSMCRWQGENTASNDE